MSVRLRFKAAVNPSTPQFDALSPEEPVTFVPLEDVWPNGLSTSRTARKSEVTTGYTRFLDGDIVVPKITPTFQADRAAIASNLAGGIGAGTTELHVVRCGSTVDARYIRYLFSSSSFLQGGAAELIGVAGQKRVPDTWLRDFPIPVVDRTQQQAIADYLDVETARIDALIAKKRLHSKLARERFRTAIEARLNHETAGLTPVRRLLLNPPQYGAGESGNVSVDGGPRYIRITDLNSDGSLKQDDPRFLDPAIARPFMLRDGDLLFARSGATVGKAFLYRKKMGASSFAGYLIRLRFDRRLVLPELIYYWTRTSGYWEQIREGSIQSTIANVNAERFKDLLVPVPPSNQQPVLVQTFIAQERSVGSLVLALGHQLDLLAEHRQALITAAVTGAIDIPGTAA